MHNGEAGVRYHPQISTVLQRNIVSWLDRAEQPELEANGIYLIPPSLQSSETINYRSRAGGPQSAKKTTYRHHQATVFFESQLDHRQIFGCPSERGMPRALSKQPANFELELEAVGHEYGLPPKAGCTNLFQKNRVLANEQ
ncbi:hypothetical protein niasHS_011814 [Heterodera schachtii]|uniref:Uncharacterized protein n=1 Tax=Heterodera schachtii TaxID=97005 RepID=A0ABD2ITR0_HETSC